MVATEALQRQERRSSRRSRWVVLLAACALTFGTTGTAAALPPPPPNPSDSELSESRTEQRQRAGEVGQLTNQLAGAEERLAALRDEVAVNLELANKARVDAERARDAAAQAKREAETARRESDAAGEGIVTARKQADRFVSGSFQQGSTVGSLTAYIGSDSPKDVLSRAQLLDAVSKKQLDALEGMRQARIAKANADAAARKAVEVAEQKQQEAEDADQAATEAHATAVQARATQAERTRELEADRDAVQRQLYEAQRKVRGLEGQRQRFEEWQEEKRREEERKAREAAEAAAAAAAATSGGGAARPAPAPAPAQSGATVETVIARAMSQLGVPYAWGGGNTQGPTYGIRDGGVADSFGDYRKIGFDCSGLMIYAFAPVKTMPHYSGYQYHEGRKVPLSQMKRGDMLFWGTQRIHHVALYLGNGQMIEAPQSGQYVRVSPVRYGDILPYATRLIE